MPPLVEPREFLLGLFRSAVAAAQAERCIGAHLPEPPKGRTIVVGAGKASAAMARALERRWPRPLEGTVVTRHGYAVACDRVEVLQAAHPVPDQYGGAAARRLYTRVHNLAIDDLVVGLFSGGGSALLALPGEGVSLDEIRDINRQLLASGASIADVNCLRRHLSAITGGRLAAACAPARVTNLLISDVPGDTVWDIASGPMVADPTTCDDAIGVAAHYGIHLSTAAQRLLKSGTGETLKPGDPRLARVETRVIATPRQALDAATSVARRAGVAPIMLGDRIEGEAHDVGATLADIALQIRAHRQPNPSPCVLLSGGEVTVTVRGNGCGGPNAECALALAIALNGAEGIHALCADTDGIDGIAEIAGALVDPTTLARAHEAGLDPMAQLAANNAHAFFERLCDTLVTGPTFTNVNDFRAILIA